MTAVSGEIALNTQKSTVNSSSTPLGSAGEFEGEWETNNAEHVLVNVLADQDGTLVIEFSADGGSTVLFTATRTIYANTAYIRSLVKGPGRSVKVTYTNGGSAQSAFQLYTAFGNSLFPLSSSDDNELLITETERERDTFIEFVKSGIAASGYSILVDLSDTTNFPHDRTGRIDISEISISVDRDSTATGVIKIGVIVGIDGTDADIVWATQLTFEKSDTRNISKRQRYSPSQLKLGVSGGALTRGISNNTTASETSVNTGVTLESPRGAGTVTPAVGDVIVYYGRSAGTYDLDIFLTYHGEVSV